MIKQDLYVLLTSIISAAATIVNAFLTYYKPANFTAWINVCDAITSCAVICLGYFVIKETRKTIKR